MIYNQWVVVDEYGIWMLIGVIYIYIYSECKFFRDIVRFRGI